MIVGVDAFDREYIWQRMWYAQRFFYTGRQPLDTIDRMLWDLASRHACKPIYKLLGGAREKVPAYGLIGGRTIDAIVESAMDKRAQGFVGGKDHWYRGVEGNAEMARELRAAMGDDFLLLHDPVESYTCEEAIRISHILEKYNYEWIEEPLQDYDILGLQTLCKAVDLPVLRWSGSVPSAVSPSTRLPTWRWAPPISCVNAALVLPDSSRSRRWPRAWACRCTAVTRT